MAEAFYDYPLPCGCSLMDGRCGTHADMMGAIHEYVHRDGPGANGRIQSIMDEADGYGEPGFFPGGYDWSGIRDSTIESVEAMFEVTQRG